MTERDALWMEMVQALRSALRRFDRDNIPQQHEQRPSGAGVWTFTTYAEANRIRDLLARADRA